MTETMSPRERLLAALRGEATDRLPWSPFPAYWWERQPESIRAAGQVAAVERMGGDPLLRGRYDQGEPPEPLILFKTGQRRCTKTDKIEGHDWWTTYETPVGTLTARRAYVDSADTWFLVDHPVKTEADLKTLAYLNEDMVVEPDQERYLAERARLGERALHVPVIGTELKTSFQQLLEHWCGTEGLVYALMDYPETVEACLAAMARPALESVTISVDSPAEAFIFWEDSSTTNLSPAYYEQYVAPQVRAWADVIHAEGKVLAQHACGHVRDLLEPMAATGIDYIESISPPPTGDVEVWEARARLPEMGFIGGIEPTKFQDLSEPELADYVTELMDKVGPGRFILANSDSCPPGVTWEKFELVSRLVRDRGRHGK